IGMRIESLALEDGYTKAGLMARESLSPNSRHVDANAFPDNRQHGNDLNGGFEFIYRAATGGTSGGVDPAPPSPRVNYPNTWIRLKREGDIFTAYAGTNGVSWTPYATYTLAMSNTLYFGIAATSHNPATNTTAR